MWLNQNFLLPEEIESKDTELDMMFLSLRTGNPLVIKMDQTGNVSNKINFIIILMMIIHTHLLGLMVDLLRL